MIRLSDQLEIVLAHDWLVGLRGGEWVLDRLAQMTGPTKLYTMVSDGQPLTDAIDACEVITSPLQRLPGASGRWRRWYLPLMPRAVTQMKVAPCDIIISTSSAFIKSIPVPSGAAHLCYCHSPARYLWEQTSDYAQGQGGRLRSFGLSFTGPRLRKWDKKTSAGVTKFLANSQHTAHRIERCYGRKAQVCYPPVRVSYFTPDENIERQPWWLVVAALEPYKRTDLVIEAARRGGFALKVAGSGSQFEELRRHAPDQVEFLGRVTDEYLRQLYRQARGLIFPQLEDFGIIAVEAQASGCPVLAFGDGGALEIVTPETGWLFNDVTAHGIAGAVKAAAADQRDSEACVANAQRFSPSVFEQSIADAVDALMAGKERLVTCGGHVTSEREGVLLLAFPLSRE